MDISAKYIMMCEKAKEVQRLAKKRIDFGDWVAVRSGKIAIVANLFRYNKTYNWIKNSIWLPRQDQLQEMMIGATGSWDKRFKYKTWQDVLEIFYNYMSHSEPYEGQWFDLENSDYGNLWHCKSMEQLWLCFVMGEKYHKTWNDNNELWLK